MLFRSVLDVGCGTGTVLFYVHESRNIRGYGLDVSEHMIAVAKEKNPEFSFVTGDSAKLPYYEMLSSVEDNIIFSN